MKELPGFLSQYRGLRKEIYILFFGRVVTNLGSMVYPMLTMILSQKLGLSAGNISVVMVATSVIMLPANYLGGRLADRCNKKWIIVCFDSVSILCYLFCGLLPLSYVTIALMLLAGICQSIEYPSYDALIADLTATRDRERAYSLQYLGANLGLVLSPTIAGLLFQNYLWLAFIISALAIGCSTLLIALRIRDITPEKDESEEAVYQAARGGASLWRILSENRVLLLYLLIMSLFHAVYGQYNYLLPLDMGRVHGGQGAVIFGTVSSLNCIVVVLCTPLITRLFRRLAETRKLFTGEALIAVGYLLFLTLLGHIPVYYLAMLLFTWGEIFTTIAGGPYLSSRIPATHRGRINGFSAVFGTVIQGSCYLAVGRIYDVSGPVAAWIVALSLLGAVLLLTLLLSAKDKRAYPKLYSAAAKEKTL